MYWTSGPGGVVTIILSVKDRHPDSFRKFRNTVIVLEVTKECTDCTNPIFYLLSPKCFGSSLPSSGNFLDPSELLEIQIEWVVYHIMCGYVACVPDCPGSDMMAG
jgi:hypothetical protein